MVDKYEKFYIGTIRFTNETFKENSEWRKKHKWKGCIYGLNKKMPTTVPYMALVFVWCMVLVHVFGMVSSVSYVFEHIAFIVLHL